MNQRPQIWVSWPQASAANEWADFVAAGATGFTAISNGQQDSIIEHGYHCLFMGAGSDAASHKRAADEGAQLVLVGDIGVYRPELIADVAQQIGTERVAVRIAVAQQDEGWSVLIGGDQSDSGLDAIAWAIDASRRGAGTIVLACPHEGAPSQELVEAMQNATASKIILELTVSALATHSKPIPAGRDLLIVPGAGLTGAAEIGNWIRKYRQA